MQYSRKYSRKNEKLGKLSWLSFHCRKNTYCIESFGIALYMKLQAKRNDVQENSFIKVYWIDIPLKKNATCYKQTTEMFFVIRPSTFLKILFLFFVSTRGQKRDKSKFFTKFVEIIVTIIFIKKYLSNC